MLRLAFLQNKDAFNSSFGAPPYGRATKNWSIDSFLCSPPRKSLVKGERFMRDLKENQSKGK